MSKEKVLNDIRRGLRRSGPLDATITDALTHRMQTVASRQMPVEQRPSVDENLDTAFTKQLVVAGASVCHVRDDVGVVQAIDAFRTVEQLHGCVVVNDDEILNALPFATSLDINRRQSVEQMN